MRSLLFAPADSERKLEKALASGADGIILDLEDSVLPEAKIKAREQAAAFLAGAVPRTLRPRLYVRVNQLESALMEADLDAVMPFQPDGIVLPKCGNGAQVQHLGALLAVKEAQYDIAAGSARVIAIATETAASIFNMGTYTNASSRLEGLTWGAEDLAACLGAGAERGANGLHTSPYLLARSLTLFAAAASGTLAIDGIHRDFRDLAALRSECDLAKRDGFGAKLAIHPAQISIINDSFTPSRESIARARAIVAAFAAEPGAGVIGLDGKMLDRPHLVRARQLLAKIGDSRAR